MASHIYSIYGCRLLPGLVGGWVGWWVAGAGCWLDWLQVAGSLHVAMSLSDDACKLTMRSLPCGLPHQNLTGCNRVNLAGSR